MILVTGSIVAKPGRFDEALAFAREHVALSRAEHGCIGHEVFRDPDDPMRLFFFERWSSLEALQTHFAAAKARGFSASVHEVAAASEIQLYEARETRA